MASIDFGAALADGGTSKQRVAGLCVAQANGAKPYRIGKYCSSGANVCRTSCWWAKRNISAPWPGLFWKREIAGGGGDSGQLLGRSGENANVWHPC